MTPTPSQPDIDEIQHILGHCMCTTKQKCWYNDTYSRIFKEEFDTDIVDARMHDEQDRAIQSLLLEARINQQTKLYQLLSEKNLTNTAFMDVFWEEGEELRAAQQTLMEGKK